MDQSHFHVVSHLFTTASTCISTSFTGEAPPVNDTYATDSSANYANLNIFNYVVSIKRNSHLTCFSGMEEIRELDPVLGRVEEGIKEVFEGVTLILISIEVEPSDAVGKRFMQSNCFFHITHYAH